MATNKLQRGGEQKRPFRQLANQKEEEEEEEEEERGGEFNLRHK